MEGLIPMVYKSIKKSRTRRHYEYLGSGGSAPLDYNSFYANNDRYMSMNNGQKYAAHHHDKKTDAGFNRNAENVEGHHHRRYQSFQLDYNTGGFSPMDTTTTSSQSKKLVRFRSHRFFSCVTGA